MSTQSSNNQSVNTNTNNPASSLTLEELQSIKYFLGVAGNRFESMLVVSNGNFAGREAIVTNLQECNKLYNRLDAMTRSTRSFTPPTTL